MNTTRNRTGLAGALSVALCLVAAWVLPTAPAHADTFGSGGNQFDIEFVDIGNPGNPADTTGDPNPAGSVPYAYRMGKFEISEDMIDKANALGGLGITHNDRGDNKPATAVSWFEAAMFVNWLNDEKGASPAYKFNGSTFELWQSGDAGYNPANPFRNSQAFYFLPSVDEWYKAAYYDPTAGLYYDFPTGSNSTPTAVASGTAAHTAVYSQGSPADITLAGGLSPYGTMGQGGNAWEWQETETDLMNDSSSSDRILRGGPWHFPSAFLKPVARATSPPSSEDFNVGFRVASIPEPASAVLLGVGGLLMLLRRRKLFQIRARSDMKATHLLCMVFIAVLACAVPARAAVIATMQEVGNDIVVSGGGEVNLAGLTAVGGSSTATAGMTPGNPSIGFGAAPSLALPVDRYTGMTPPSTFGAGLGAGADTGSGDRFVALPTELFVPDGYISNAALVFSNTYLNSSFASLVITPGTYVWTWGSDASADSFTLNIVPEPASAALLAIGGLALLAGHRRWP